MFKFPFLTSLLVLPMLGSSLILLLREERYPNRARWTALFTCLICMLLGILLCQNFDLNYAGLQFQEDHVWIHSWNIHYSLGIDGISLSLILLTIFTTLLVILASWHSFEAQNQYLAALLLVQALVTGSFAATDALFFYVCWEAVLIPMMLMIGIWGSQQRAYAALKFFMYTFLGSALLLLAFLYLSYKAGTSFAIVDFYTLKLDLAEQMLLFFAFLLAFAVKIPLWPLHTWLPDAHTEASAGSSMILAGLMLKLGGYGLLRFSLPIMPDAARLCSGLLCGVALVAIISIGLTALAQRDMKRLVAYSSIAHMGIVVLGIFLIFPIIARFPDRSAAALMSLQGAMVQMIAHAFSASALFLAIGMLYRRFHSRLIADYRGLAHTTPVLATFFMLFSMSNLGLPGTAGFVGEFLVILSAMHAHFGLSFAAGTTLILSAAYTLYLYKRLFWGKAFPMQGLGIKSSTSIMAKSQNTSLQINLPEKVSLILLSASILGLGIWPAPLLSTIQPPLAYILQLSLHTKL